MTSTSVAKNGLLVGELDGVRLMADKEALSYVAIMRDIFARTGGQPKQWTALEGVLERLAQNNQVAFKQAIDLARMKGLLITEGTPPYRACLTNAGRVAAAKDL
jgi:hypothetical protein